MFCWKFPSSQDLKLRQWWVASRKISDNDIEIKKEGHVEKHQVARNVGTVKEEHGFL